MQAWFERIRGWLLLVGLALAAFASVFYRGRATGRQTERQERQNQINEQAGKARQEARNVQLETDRLDDDAIADELERDWVRGPGPRGR